MASEEEKAIAQRMSEEDFKRLSSEEQRYVIDLLNSGPAPETIEPSYPQLLPPTEGPLESSTIGMPRISQQNLLPFKVGPYEPDVSVSDIYKGGSEAIGGVAGSVIGGALGGPAGGYLGAGVGSAGGAIKAQQDLNLLDIAGAKLLGRKSPEVLSPIATQNIVPGFVAGVAGNIPLGPALARGPVKVAEEALMARAAPDALLADPSVRTGLALAEKGRTGQVTSEYGFLTKPASEITNLGPREKQALALIQRQAEDPRMAPVAIGAPESRTDRQIDAVFSQLQEATDDLYKTKLLERGGKIDPYSTEGGNVAIFDGSGPAPASMQEAGERLAQAKSDVMTAKADITSTLDNALMEMAAKSPDALDRAKGIRIEDILPTLQQTRETIARLKLNAETSSMGEAAQAKLNNILADFDRIQSEVFAYRPTYGALAGNIEKGELLPSQVDKMIRNYNQARRSLGEFTESAMAGAANANPTMLGEMRTAIDAMANIQGALDDALAANAADIISRAKSFPGYSNARVAVSKYDPDIIRRINRTYKVFDPWDREVERYNKLTAAAFVPPPGKGLESTIRGAIPTTKQGVISAGVEKAANYFRPPPSQALIDAQRIYERDVLPIETLRGYAQLRANPIPRLAREWRSVKASGGSASIGAMATLAGLVVAPQAFEALSEGDKSKIFETVVGYFPESFLPGPEGYQSFVNGKLTSPMDQSFHLERALEAGSIAQQAEIVSGINDRGKYIPLVSSVPPTPSRVQLEPTIGLDTMAQAFDMEPNAAGTFEQVAPPTETDEMVKKMQATSGAWASGY